MIYESIVIDDSDVEEFLAIQKAIVDLAKRLSRIKLHEQRIMTHDGPPE